MSSVSQELSKLRRFLYVKVQGMTKSHFLEIFKCQYIIEILRYVSNILHVIITVIGFKITSCNIRSHGAPLLISRENYGFGTFSLDLSQSVLLIVDCLSLNSNHHQMLEPSFSLTYSPRSISDIFLLSKPQLNPNSTQPNLG